MYPFFRSLLFRLEPERAHHLTLSLMRLVGVLPPLQVLLRGIFASPTQPIQAFGLTFPNRVGLAAGYDKDGQAWRGLACLGFGHIELGTVTLLPQPGNPPPRIFRLSADEALINRMGFPSQGVKAVMPRLRKARPGGLVLGVNIGKNKDTPLEAAGEEYVTLLRLFAPYADYLAINVSSPNTAGLRRLQARDALEGLLKALQAERLQQVARLGHPLPLLVKLAPDLSDAELADALEVILAHGMDGVIATNTTLARPALHSVHARQAGGLSGKPLHPNSLAMVRAITRQCGGRLAVIGVGGITNATSAQAMLDAGACLLQVYTGLVYGGPGLVRNILTSLAI
ncbi:MAG: quinone-dependent dihydroorotate dehydrogenase [Anaerolineales bacterium]|nr:quinone-dependent dihydroorotate dehydrogenase [Anaerolineales bacterium]